MPARADAVFINVPFDRRYKKLFDGLVFAVHACGFVARCAREQDDGSQVRVDKLYDIIADCRYGIHDLSRTSLDSANRLPRYQIYCSDIAGQDIRAHEDQLRKAIAAVRDWLRGVRASTSIPGPAAIATRYARFTVALPAMCRALELDVRELSFLDYRTLVAGWLDANP